MGPKLLYFSFTHQLTVWFYVTFLDSLSPCHVAFDCTGKYTVSTLCCHGAVEIRDIILRISSL